MKLYGYWRSSTSYRVRIALNLKNIEVEHVPVNLLKSEHRDNGFASMNSSRSVPILEVEGVRLAQSQAIIEYLEEVYPEPSLLPSDAIARSRVRAMAQLVACDIHPVNNLRILKYLSDELQVTSDQKNAWMQRWFAEGFAALESMVRASGQSGACCYGDVPTMADIALIPQLYNARRFGAPLEDYPTLLKVESHCLQLPAFDQARPENQPDAVVN
jgi:maleylacetoacetate isomerase